LNGILFSTVPRTLDSRHLPQLRNSPYTTDRAAIHHRHRMGDGAADGSGGGAVMVVAVD